MAVEFVNKQSFYKTFIENKQYQNIFPMEITDIWQEKRICRLHGKMISFEVTGLLIFKGEFLMIFPKSYELPTTDIKIKKHIEILIKVLLKYKTENVLDPLESELLGGKNGGNIENLITAYQLIQDFTQNGYLLKETLIKSTNYSGKVDWPTTIKKRHPILSEKYVVYDNPIFHKKITDQQNLLVKLHKYCIYKSIEEFGWLLGISSDFAEPEQNLLINYDLTFLINFLTSELNNTFVDRGINVITLLIQFISGVNPENPEEKLETLATPYFQNVWETMCSVNFKNQYHSLKQIIPKLKWEIDSNATVQPQRPDLIIIRGNTLYILDAKYYNIEKNLPGWSDIVKQLFYGYTIYSNIQSNENLVPHLKIHNITRVYNAFLFPSSKLEAISYAGKVEVEGNIQLGNIKAFSINTFLMMKCYIGIENFPFINNFVKVSNDIT